MKKFIKFLRPVLLPLVVFFAILYGYLLRLTCTVKFHGDKQAIAAIDKEGPALFLIWHGRFFVFPIYLRRHGFSAIVSGHRDGNALARFLRHFGLGIVHGSSRRGAFSAVKSAISTLKKNKKLVITPDGPLGPRFQVKGSIISLMRVANAPAYCLCFSASSLLKFKSWDRFILPLPFSTITLHFSEKMVYSDTLTNEEISEKMLAQTKSVDKIHQQKIDY